MVCGLGEEERTRFRKKKGKKGKKPIAAKSGLVGITEYLQTYNRVKYFFAILKPLFNETAFYAKVLGRFLTPKTKVT